MPHHHLYEQRPNRARVVIIATRANRHTLRDLKMAYDKSDFDDDPTWTFIRQCPVGDDLCTIRGDKWSSQSNYGLRVGRQVKNPLRNAEIVRRCAAGETTSDIAKELGLTWAAVYGVIARHRAA